MKIRSTLAALTVATLGFAAPVVASAPVHAATHHHGSLDAKHACTKTSSGTCIKGGQLCPQSKYGKSGWDAQGHRYVCKGSKSHPHWMKP